MKWDLNFIFLFQRLFPENKLRIVHFETTLGMLAFCGGGDMAVVKEVSRTAVSPGGGRGRQSSKLCGQGP